METTGSVSVGLLMVAGVGLVLMIAWIVGLIMSASRQAWGVFAALFIVPCLLSGMLVASGFLFARKRAAVAHSEALQAREEALVAEARAREPIVMLEEDAESAGAALRRLAESAGLEVDASTEPEPGRLRVSARGERAQLERWLQLVEEAGFTVSEFELGVPDESWTDSGMEQTLGGFITVER